MTTNNQKLYRVDWKQSTDIIPGQFFDEYSYIAATSETEAIKDLYGTDFKVREATIEEMEAYVRGYEDGYDSGVLTERIRIVETSEEV